MERESSEVVLYSPLIRIFLRPQRLVSWQKPFDDCFFLFFYREMEWCNSTSSRMRYGENFENTKEERVEDFLTSHKSTQQGAGLREAAIITFSCCCCCSIKQQTKRCFLKRDRLEVNKYPVPNTHTTIQQKPCESQRRRSIVPSMPLPLPLFPHLRWW